MSYTIENLEERGEKLYDREGCRSKRREGRSVKETDKRGKCGVEYIYILNTSLRNPIIVDIPCRLVVTYSLP